VKQSTGLSRHRQNAAAEIDFQPGSIGFHKNQDKIEELKLLLRKISFYKDAPVGKYFESKDGVIVKNVFELLNLLKITDESVFKHHTAENRNDFALWIKEVIGDKELAAKLNKSGSKKEIISILEDASAGKS